MKGRLFVCIYHDPNFVNTVLCDHFLPGGLDPPKTDFVAPSYLIPWGVTRGSKVGEFLCELELLLLPFY